MLVSRASRKILPEEVNGLYGDTLLARLSSHSLVMAVKGNPKRAVQAALLVKDGISLAQALEALQPTPSEPLDVPTMSPTLGLL